MSRLLKSRVGGSLTSLALVFVAQAVMAQTAPAKAPSPRAAGATTPSSPNPAAATPPANAAPGAPTSNGAAPAAPGGPAASSIPDRGTVNAWSLPDDDGSVTKSETELEIERRFAALRAGKGITADQVALRTVKNSPTLEQKRRAVEGAESGIQQAKGGNWPALKLSASYMRLSRVHVEFPAFAPGQPPLAFDYPQNSYSLDASINVPLSDYVLKNSHAIAAASHSRDAASFDQLAEKASVARDGRVNYYNWISAQAAELIALQALDQAKGHQRDAENGFQAGLNSKADVLRTQADATTAQLAVERAQNATELARLAMQVGMGDPSGQRYDAGEDVFTEPPELLALPQPEPAYQEALTHRAELKSLVAVERAAREQATATRAGNLPRLDGQAAATYANPNQRYITPQPQWKGTWQAGLVLSWMPFQISGNEGAASGQDAKAAEAIAQQRGLKEALRIEIENARRSAEIAHLAIEADTQALVSAREAYRVRRELFRAGRATLVEVTDAATDLNRTRFRLADDYIQARIALAELHHALGRDAELVGDAARTPQ